MVVWLEETAYHGANRSVLPRNSQRDVQIA